MTDLVETAPEADTKAFEDFPTPFTNRDRAMLVAVYETITAIGAKFEDDLIPMLKASPLGSMLGL